MGTMIKNYTTRVSVERTVSEIIKILGKQNVNRVIIDYEGNDPIGLMFVHNVNNNSIQYRLPCHWKGVYACLREKSPNFKDTAHAQRVAWRNLKDWLDVQFAMIQARSAEFPEIFLPYAVNSKGETFYQYFKDNYQKLLNP